MSNEQLPEAVREQIHTELARFRTGPHGWSLGGEPMDLIASALTRVAEAAAQQERARLCTWTAVDEPDSWDVWHTTCGHAFQFNDGGPTDNHCQWCCYCGGKLVASHPPPTPEDR